MSWVWKADNPLRTPEQVMAELIRIINVLDFPDRRGAAICAGMCIAQESDFWCPWNANDPESVNYDHDSQSDDGRSVGYFQQQKGPNGELWWGTTESEMDLTSSATQFLTRLYKGGYDASNAQAANDSVQRVQRSGVPQGYRKHWDRINDLYNRVSSGGQQVGISGDPVWLEDVLRPVLGDRLRTLPGWKEAGVGGTMGNIWGVIWHHTGDGRATAESIRNGRPDLAGPLAQLHMAQNGIVTIVAVGPCNHAGRGSWNGLPTDNANNRTIGIEMAWPNDTSITEATQMREDWPPAMIQSMIDVGAALALKIGNGQNNNISHSEWARFGPAGWRQGKWDPGNLNMEWIRNHIGDRMRDLQGGQPPAPTPAPPKAPVLDRAGGSADDQLQYRWNQLGGQTLVEAVAQIRDKVLGTQDAGKPGVKTL